MATMDTIMALFTPFVIQTGACCMTVQMLLAAAFHVGLLGDGPWKQYPLFTAHQVVVIPVLVFLSVNGCIDWSRQLYFGDEVFSQAERVDAVRNLYLSEFVFGMMLFWDLPTSLLSKELRDVPMVLHHVGMVIVSAVAMGVLSDGRPLLGYYAPFFFGLVEVSSIPLVLVDMFHPKHKEWSAYLRSQASPWLNQLNETCRLVFAALFLALRALYFPFETVMGVVPDLLAYRRSGTDMPNLPLDILVVTNLMFSMLQLYWGFLIMKTLIKVLSGASGKSKAQ